MKTYIFTDKSFFNKIYETYFAMRIFHRETENGTLLIRFITKKQEKELMRYSFISSQLTEFKENEK